MNEPSIFTKIITGEIPCHKVYENEHTLAFLDIHPVQPGHTLVVPKRQVEFVWDLDEGEYQQLMESVRLVARHMRAKLEVPYVGTQIVGVDVPHAHVHIIPFATTDGFRHLPDMSVDPDHQQLAAMAERIRM